MSICGRPFVANKKAVVAFAARVALLMFELLGFGKRHDSLPKSLEPIDTKLSLERFTGDFAPTSPGMPTNFGEKFVEVFVRSDS